MQVPFSFGEAAFPDSVYRNGPSADVNFRHHICMGWNLRGCCSKKVPAEYRLEDSFLTMPQAHQIDDLEWYVDKRNVNSYGYPNPCFFRLTPGFVGGIERLTVSYSIEIGTPVSFYSVGEVAFYRSALEYPDEDYSKPQTEHDHAHNVYGATERFEAERNYVKSQR